MDTKQTIDQLNDIHTMLAKLPIEKTVYQIMSDKLIRIKDSVSKNFPQPDVSDSLPISFANWLGKNQWGQNSLGTWKRAVAVNEGAVTTEYLYDKFCREKGVRQLPLTFCG